MPCQLHNSEVVMHQNLSELSRRGELALESADKSDCSDWLQGILTQEAHAEV